MVLCRIGTSSGGLRKAESSRIPKTVNQSSKNFSLGVGTRRNLCSNLPYSPIARVPGAICEGAWYGIRSLMGDTKSSGPTP